MALTKDVNMVNNFKNLDQQGKVQAEYVWIGGSMTTGGMDLRSKTKTLSRKPTKLSDLPIWNYDGSSTCQAEGHFSEVLMIPVAMFPDPFRGGDNLLVLCETEKDGVISAENFRRGAKMVFDQDLAAEPWFGIEQEYTLFEKDGRTPLGWPSGGYPGPQGPYYCGAGTDCSFGRAVSDAHYACCLHAGINISGTNAEVMAGQWEYQIGPCTGIESGDHLWMSRYLLIRVCEMFDVNVTFDPKPMPGDWNGAGCHTNYSTAAMRAPGGYDVIIAAVEDIGKKHKEHLAVYGSGNERRLTGAHETANINEFKYGVSDRGASIRIPTVAKEEGCGYLEDRRPASNIDPYIVTAKIFDTTVVKSNYLSKGVAKFSSVDLADLNLDMSQLQEQA